MQKNELNHKSTDHTPLKFHIIYTPYTVDLLAFFVWSLLKYSECTFCLVSNACTEQEDQFLQILADTEERLSFLKLPNEEVWKHGKVLNFLYERENSDYFSFMDSDIFAIRPFMSQFLPLIQTHVSVSSCSSLWMREKDKVLPKGLNLLSGRYHKTKQGICLGSTYFAIYNLKRINALSNFSDIDFQKKVWEDLSIKQQSIFTNPNFRPIKFDTAKLLNLLLANEKEKLCFAENNSLIHFGGFSNRMIEGNKIKVKSKIKLSFLDHIRIVYYYVRRKLELVYRKNRQIKLRAKTKQRKIIVSHYFLQLLISLKEETPLPSFPKLDDKKIRISLEKATKAIVKTHEEYKKEFKPRLRLKEVS